MKREEAGLLSPLFVIMTSKPLVFSIKFLVIGLSNEKNIKQDLRLYEGIFIYPILFVYKSVCRDSFEQINNPGLIE